MKKPFYKRFWFKALVIIIIIGIIGSGGDDDKEIEPTKQAASDAPVKASEAIKEPEPVKEPEPEVIVTAKEVIDLFEENEIKGKQTYTGKLAEITGVVDNVSEMMGQSFATLNGGGDFELVSLQCFFKDEDQINMLAELKKGDTITIIGTIGEQSINISVKDCKFK